MPESSNRRILRHQFANIPSRITTAVYLYAVSSKENKREPTKALWDTGAQISAITPYMAKLLNLQPIYQTGIGGAHGVNQTDIVVVHLEIPELGAYKDLKAAVCSFNPDPNSDIHMIIGMDLIAQGDFLLSNGNDNTLFSFAAPPSLTKIDLSAIQ